MLFPVCHRFAADCRSRATVSVIPSSFSVAVCPVSVVMSGLSVVRQSFSVVTGFIGHRRQFFGRYA
ncbi:hypothetical protein OYT88_16000 [Sporolactobacillus sp. CQH2019]|uniref:hypothetical protein n=1 Tax=Sporolactobacillus sp. CQH2019 TaxID=3023512 RepID=UPI002368C634|nr:hypothetical protein [Sporolactobacillus sp. CQH2019]MDD9150045.1 hypothetical protein [Sporolactobacillus sp. CQH2019]